MPDPNPISVFPPFVRDQAFPAGPATSAGPTVVIGVAAALAVSVPDPTIDVTVAPPSIVAVG